MKNYIIAAIIITCFSQNIFGQVKPISALIKTNGCIQKATIPDLNIEQQSGEKKSVTLAVVASLLMPGMGELYVGSFKSGKYHLIAEAGLWLTYTGFRSYSSWIRRDAKTYATEHAGANFVNKDEQFDVNIGNFKSTADYNEAKARNREYDQIYWTDQAPNYLWNWDSDESRLKFKDLRIRSDQVKNNAKFIIGVVVVNHIVSAFSAWRKAVAYNKSLTAIDNIQIHAYTINIGSRIEGAGLNITTSF